MVQEAEAPAALAHSTTQLAEPRLAVREASISSFKFHVVTNDKFPRNLFFAHCCVEGI